MLTRSLAHSHSHRLTPWAARNRCKDSIDSKDVIFHHILPLAGNLLNHVFLHIHSFIRSLSVSHSHLFTRSIERSKTWFDKWESLPFYGNFFHTQRHRKSIVSNFINIIEAQFRFSLQIHNDYWVKLKL